MSARDDYPMLSGKYQNRFGPIQKGVEQALDEIDSLRSEVESYQRLAEELRGDFARIHDISEQHCSQAHPINCVVIP
jgi:hypothetical protein